MAGDDKGPGESSDPWADIESGLEAEAVDDNAFTFEPVADLDAASSGVVEDGGPDPSIAEDAGQQPAARDDEGISPWGDEGPVEPEAARLTVFSPDEPAASDADIAALLDGDEDPLRAVQPVDEAGGGDPFAVVTDEAEVREHVSRDSEVVGEAIDAWDEAEVGDDATAEGEETADSADDPFAFTAGEASAPEPTEADGGEEGFDTGVGPVAVATAAAAARSAAKPKKKGGGIGQVIGIVLGGALAFPLVFGILIGLMWAGVNVPVGRSIGRALPESMAFLVPEKYRPGYRKPAANLAQAARLDDLPAMAEGDTSVPAASGDSPLDALAASSPMPEPDASPGSDEPSVDVTDSAPVVPADDEGLVDPLDVAAAPAVASPMPSPPPPPTAPPEPEPLDLSGLEAAITEARTALDAVGQVADPTDPARKTLLVEWYKALANVAEQYVLLEHVAADSGRPLQEAPAVFVELHDDLVARQRELDNDLVRLSRNWLAFADRDIDGVVLSVTFDSARKVGPYWSSKVSLALPKGASRDLSIISRAEPAAVKGDRVLVTGVVFDGDAIWAADVRRLGAAPATDY